MFFAAQDLSEPMLASASEAGVDDDGVVECAAEAPADAPSPAPRRWCGWGADPDAFQMKYFRDMYNVQMGLLVLIAADEVIFIPLRDAFRFSLSSSLAVDVVYYIPCLAAIAVRRRIRLLEPDAARAWRRNAQLIELLVLWRLGVVCIASIMALLPPNLIPPPQEHEFPCSTIVEPDAAAAYALSILFNGLLLGASALRLATKMRLFACIASQTIIGWSGCARLPGDLWSPSRATSWLAYFMLALAIGLAVSYALEKAARADWEASEMLRTEKLGLQAERERLRDEKERLDYERRMLEHQLSKNTTHKKAHGRERSRERVGVEVAEPAEPADGGDGGRDERHEPPLPARRGHTGPGSTSSASSSRHSGSGGSHHSGSGSGVSRHSGSSVRSRDSDQASRVSSGITTVMREAEMQRTAYTSGSGEHLPLGPSGGYYGGGVAGGGPRVVSPRHGWMGAQPLPPQLPPQMAGPNPQPLLQMLPPLPPEPPPPLTPQMPPPQMPPPQMAYGRPPALHPQPLGAYVPHHISPPLAPTPVCPPPVECSPMQHLIAQHSARQLGGAYARGPGSGGSSDRPPFAPYAPSALPMATAPRPPHGPASLRPPCNYISNPAYLTEPSASQPPSTRHAHGAASASAISGASEPFAVSHSDTSGPPVKPTRSTRRRRQRVSALSARFASLGDAVTRAGDRLAAAEEALEAQAAAAAGDDDGSARSIGHGDEALNESASQGAPSEAEPPPHPPALAEEPAAPTKRERGAETARAVASSGGSTGAPSTGAGASTGASRPDSAPPPPPDGVSG